MDFIKISGVSTLLFLLFSLPTLQEREVEAYHKNIPITFKSPEKLNFIGPMTSIENPNPFLTLKDLKPTPGLEKSPLPDQQVSLFLEAPQKKCPDCYGKGRLWINRESLNCFLCDGDGLLQVAETCQFD